MIKKNLIFVNDYPINNEIINKFYFNLFIDNKYQIHFINISSLLKNTNNISFEAESNRNILLYNPENINELQFLLQSIKNVQFVYFQIRLNNFRVYNIFKIIKNIYSKIVFFERGTQIVTSSIKMNIKDVTINKIIDKLQFLSIYYLFKLNVLKKFDFIFYDSNTSKSKAINYSNNLIKINNFDQEVYFKLKKDKHEKKLGKIKIVFLDDNLYGNDFDFLGLNFEKITYINKIRLFFLQLIGKNNIDFVFCAHPKSKIQIFNDVFNVEINNTAKNVNDADLIFTHYSTSIFYPILSKKKIILLDSDMFVKDFDFIRNNITYLSKKLDLSVFKIEDKLKIEDIDFNFNENNYNTYIQDFIGYLDGETDYNYFKTNLNL